MIQAELYVVYIYIYIIYINQIIRRLNTFFNQQTVFCVLGVSARVFRSVVRLVFGCKRHQKKVPCIHHDRHN